MTLQEPEIKKEEVSAIPVNYLIFVDNKCFFKSSPTMEKPRVMNEIPAFSLESSSRYGAIPKNVDVFLDHPRATHLEVPPSTPTTHVEPTKNEVPPLSSKILI